MQNANLLQLFIYCLLKANHKENEFIFNGEMLKVIKGSFVTGRFEIAKSLKMNPASVYKNLKKLESLGYISLNSNNKFTILSVCKYNTYQGTVTTKEQQSNNKVTTKEQQSNNKVTQTRMNKNEENDNNDKNIDSDFENFWNLYDKKVGDKNKIIKKFNALKEADKTKIFESLPEYIISTPDKKFRKNPETYLNNHSWNDEIIKINSNGTIKSRRNTLQDF